MVKEVIFILFKMLFYQFASLKMRDAFRASLREEAI
jgi:hypothetical protein